MPAISPYIIDPIWEQFEALLPERNVDHPLGCHNPRIPDKVVFEKLLQVLVFGCAYQRIADQRCSATTLLAPSPGRVDRLWSDGEATTDSARCLRLDDQPRAFRRVRR